MCWSAMVETGVLFIGRGVSYRKMGLHGILLISTVNLLQPPRATVHPPSTSSSLHLRLFIHGLLFIQPPPLFHRLLFNQPSPWGPVQPPLHGLLFIQPSTGYCSSSPPRGRPIHPALNGVLSIHPQSARSVSCSSRGNTTGSCSSTPTGNCSSKPPSNAHCSSRGSIDRLQLAAVAEESLDRVQLIAID